MFEELIKHAISLGMPGLLFIMWWHERQERLRAGDRTGEFEALARQSGGMLDRLLTVVGSNTEALTALREELRLHRVWEAQALGTLSKQINDIHEP